MLLILNWCEKYFDVNECNRRLYEFILEEISRNVVS